MQSSSQHAPDEELRLSDVPPDDADWKTITPFAIRFMGYSEAARHWYDQVGSKYREDFKLGTAKLDALTLTQLRICLFREQRLQRWHLQEAGYKLDLTYMHALLRAIRAKLVCNQEE